MLIVQKYGGTSLGSLQRIRRAARRAANIARQGIQTVVVVSAQGDTTDVMIQRAQQLQPTPVPRELDAYLSAGEQMSAALMAMAIRAQGIPAVSLTGWQAGITTDSQYGNARILKLDPSRIQEELKQGSVVVVAGFQGVDRLGNLTTLGRGGSDTTAVALAAALHADRCQIYTDVDGVYTCDPRVFPDAVRLERIGYDRMLTMAREGAQVLHDRCVELAKQTHTPLEVLSAFTGEPGTLVTEKL